MASAGLFTADGGGNLTNGYDDEFVEGTPTEISDSFTGTYILDASGMGRVDSQISFNKHEPAPQLIFYLTGNGNPSVVLSLDTTLGTMGMGLANPQSASAVAFNGKYGLTFTQGIGALESDSIAQISADSASGSFSGVVDSNLDFNGQLDTPLSGSFTPGTATGRYTGSLTDVFFPTPGANPSSLTMAFYLIDSAHGYFIETDSSISAELTFGYFGARTPVCATCP